MERLLLSGKESGLLDDETRGRLLGREIGFCSARAELEAAGVFLERGFGIRPRPSGRNTRVGEFELVGGTSIFVEVKALIDRPADRNEYRRTENLSTLTRTLAPRGSILSLHVTEASRDFSAARYRRWYRETFADRTSGTYQENGFGAEVAVLDPGGGLDPSQPSVVKRFVGTNHNHDYIGSSLKRACKQLPNDRPAIIVLRSFLTMDFQDADMFWALFGPIAVRLSDRQTGRTGEGLFFQDISERVSGIGLLKARWDDSGLDHSLDVFHYHCALNPLSPALLQAPNIRQSIPSDHGQLEWSVPA